MPSDVDVPYAPRRQSFSRVCSIMCVFQTRRGAADARIEQAFPSHALGLPRLETIFADQKYHNHTLDAWMAGIGPGGASRCRRGQRG